MSDKTLSEAIDLLRRWAMIRWVECRGASPGKPTCGVCVVCQTPAFLARINKDSKDA